MSDIVEKKYPLDMNPKEVESLNEFINNGLPGIISADNDKVRQATELYFNGAGYQEISVRTRLKKNIILYLSYRHNWYDTKMEMLTSMVNSIKEKMEIASLRSVDLMVDYMSTLEAYYRDSIEQYRISKNRSIIDSLDNEKFKTYVKLMEQLQKIKNPSDKDSAKSPLMGLNLPNGGTVKKIDDNTIEVLPSNSQAKEQEVSKVLAFLADLRRQREEKS
jgi:hypothetical protein